MSLINISAKALLSVAPMRARGDVRYYMNGIIAFPHPAGALVAATDGHRLAAYFDDKGRVIPGPGKENVVIGDADALVRMVKAARQLMRRSPSFRFSELRVEIDPEKRTAKAIAVNTASSTLGGHPPEEFGLTLCKTFHEWPSAKAEGKEAPKEHQIYRVLRPVFTIMKDPSHQLTALGCDSINASYMASVRDCLKEVNYDMRGMNAANYWRAKEGIHVWAAGEGSFVALVMPMRDAVKLDDSGNVALPHWLNPEVA